jgi:hypothetical protein
MTVTKIKGELRVWEMKGTLGQLMFVDITVLKEYGGGKWVTFFRSGHFVEL